jgi:tetratricopeptide (TPR) repeat protein
MFDWRSLPGATGDVRGAAPGARPAGRDWLAAAAVAGAALTALAPAVRYGLINLDDGFYVGHPLVKDGLTLRGFTWAFSAIRGANWHPLTWLSYQLDATVLGSDPWCFHLTNVLLHAANAALLFLAVRALTGAYWRSAAVALLFAVHPLRVESVAWVSERKDVLSVFFGLLALWAYAGYAARPSVARYAAVASAFVLSLMSKSMLVTLPCLFLVLDWWPRRRARAALDWRRLAAEKLPLVALSAAVSLVTLYAQESRGARRSLRQVPLTVRAENAAVAYAAYLSKTVWPSDLAIYYPHPVSPNVGGVSHRRAAGSALLLGAVSVGAVALRRRAPYLLAGWLWYLGTLVPVIGLVQVGSQAYADRYTYFPQIGLLVALCWGVSDLARGWRRTAVTAAAAAAALLSVATWNYLSYWKDSYALWEHARRTCGDNAFILGQIAFALDERHDPRGAEAYYRESLRIEPAAVLPHLGLGSLLFEQGRLDEAVEELETARDIAPDFFAVRTNLGRLYQLQHRYAEAAAEHAAAIEAAPEFGAAYCDLARVEMARGNLDRALALYRDAVLLDPMSAQNRGELGAALIRHGRRDEGEDQLRLAIRLDPKSAGWHCNLGLSRLERGDSVGAADYLQTAVALDPNLARAWRGLSRVLMRLGNPVRARECLKRAEELGPDGKRPGPP